MFSLNLGSREFIVDRMVIEVGLGFFIFRAFIGIIVLTVILFGLINLSRRTIGFTNFLYVNFSNPPGFISVGCLDDQETIRRYFHGIASSKLTFMGTMYFCPPITSVGCSSYSVFFSRRFVITVTTSDVAVTFISLVLQPLTLRTIFRPFSLNSLHKPLVIGVSSSMSS